MVSLEHAVIILKQNVMEKVLLPNLLKKIIHLKVLKLELF